MFYNYLLEKGVDSEHIIKLELDKIKDIKYRNPLELINYVNEKIVDKKWKILFVYWWNSNEWYCNNPYNKAGKKKTFYDALNDLIK